MKNVNKNQKKGFFKWYLDKQVDGVKEAPRAVEHILGIDFLKTGSESLGCFGVLLFLPFWPFVVVWRVFCLIISIIF